MIKITDIKIQRDYRTPDAIDQRFEGLIRVSATFRFPVPSAFTNLGTKIPLFVESYTQLFSLKEVENNETLVFDAAVTLNIKNPANTQLGGLTSVEDVQDKLEEEYEIYQGKLNNFQLLPFDSILGKQLIDNSWT
jgi:hypothetical protein